jgi:hypothetical protein
MTMDELLGLYPSRPLNASMQYLRQRGSVPTVDIIGGQRLGAYAPDTNTVYLNPYQDRASRYNSVAHETAHAADTALGAQNYDIVKQNMGAWLPSSRPSTESMRFSDAYNKLQPSTTKLSTGYEASPQRTQNYRTSNRELRAFGAGNTADPGAPAVFPGAPHLDTTMATEFEILLDLANRAQRNR